MVLGRDDVIVFDALQKHYNPVAVNIGIIGDTEYIKKKIGSLAKVVPHDLLIRNDKELCYRFMLDDIETTYYGIRTLDDLDNLYFKKYI